MPEMPFRMICAAAAAAALVATAACGYPPLERVCTGQTPGCSGGPPDAPDAPAGGCQAAHPTVTRTTPSIELLVDRSGSMAQNFANQAPMPGEPTKYAALRDALTGPQGAVTQLEQQAFIGLALYSDDAPCPTLRGVARARTNGQAIATVLAAQAPGGTTPTPPSIDAVVAGFTATPPPAGSPPIIVLATDGLPNQCGSPGTDTQQQSVTAAARAFALGIRLLVVSVGNTPNTAAHFQAMANAGGGGPYYPSTTPAELAAAFQAAIGATLCILSLGAPVDPASAPNATVTLDGVRLTHGTDWTLDGNGATLRLLGAACATLKTSANAVVDATFPCPPQG